MDPIVTEDLTKRYRDLVAVDQLGLQVPQGQVLGLLGPNGAGKTTTIKMLVGLVRPTAGTAWIGGHDITTDGVAARELLGYVPEVVGLYEEMTGHQLLRYTGRFFPMGQAERTRRAEELLIQVRLEQDADRKVATYSKGMRQRLALAAALFHDPGILILDEPLTGLDPEGVIAMKQALVELAREKTILLCSHELTTVASLCDRVVILQEGRVLADAPVDELTRPDPPTYELELAAATAKPGDRLAGLPTVDEVQPVEGAGGVRWRVTLAPGAEPHEALAGAVEAGLRVQAFTEARRTLEDIFIELTGVHGR